MPEHHDTNRRMDFRQDTLLRFKEEILTPEQFEAELEKPGAELYQQSLAQGMTDGDPMISEATDTLDASVFKAIQALETKLNYLIGMDVLRDSGQKLPEERLANISATGMSFSTEASLSAGDRMKITMVLPLFPPVFVEIPARVVRMKGMGKEKKRVSVTFVFRCEYEETSLIKYVFKLQREQVRAKYMRINQLTRVRDDELL